MIKFYKKLAKTPKNYKFSSDPKFKEFLYGNHIKTSSKSTQLQTPIKDDVQHIQQLKNKLSYLALFFVVWKDTAAKDNLNSSQESAEKKLRQEIKFKSNLDKDDRYAINIALQSMVFILCQQSELIVDQDKRDL